MSSEKRRSTIRFVLQAVAALVLGTVIAFGFQIPKAGWTSNDVTTGQHPGYPDLQPRRYDMSVANTTIFASEALRRVQGGKVKKTDTATGHVIGEAQVIGTPFYDDVEITITPEASHSLVNIRSHSRIGGGDFGVNAARIRSLQALMDDKLPPLP